MATLDMPIINSSFAPDSSGGVFQEPAEIAMTLATAVLDTLMVWTMQAPTGADIGVYGKFNVPQNFVSTPVLVIRGVLGEAANTLAFGVQMLPLADSEAYDAALGAQDSASNATWTGYVAEDVYVETITLSTPTFAVGDEVNFFLFRDDTVDTQTGEFYLTGLFFRYNDA